MDAPHTLFLGWLVIMACSRSVRVTPERCKLAQPRLPHGNSLYVLCGFGKKGLQSQKKANLSQSICIQALARFGLPQCDQQWSRYLCSLGQQKSSKLPATPLDLNSWEKLDNDNCRLDSDISLVLQVKLVFGGDSKVLTWGPQSWMKQLLVQNFCCLWRMFHAGGACQATVTSWFFCSSGEMFKSRPLVGVLSGTQRSPESPPKKSD